MALELPYGYKNLDPAGSSNVDESYGYYNSLAEAYAAVPLAMRKGGRTVGIKDGSGKITEYWWENDNDLSDSGLVQKNVGGGGGGGDAVWGSISGTIANQADLMAEFDKKVGKADLEIGGRNYLPSFHSPEWNIDSVALVDKYSLHFLANNGNPEAEIILDVESDTNYTFTFNSDFARYYIYEYNGGVGDVIVSGSEPEVTFNTGSSTKIRLNINTASGQRDKDRNISNLKLEKGTIATDWTPAPEDLVTDWNETDETSFSFLKNKPTIPDEFNPSEHDLDEFKNQSANPFARMDDLPPPFDPTYLENNIQNLENNKVDKDGDKQLSDENFSNEEKQKLANIEEGAQVNVIPDWDADTENPRRIDNKPTHVSQFVNDGDKTSPFATLKDIYRTNIVLNYGIVNIEGTYQYDLWADRYIINNVLYTEMITGSVTLSSPHPTLDRIDKIVIHSDGEFRVKEGVPALNPVSPQVDAQTEVEVRFILVKGGSTEPDTDVYRVYDENEELPNEWNVSLLQGNIDPDNVEYASRGTKSIKFNIDAGVSRIIFTPAEPIYFEDFSEILLDVRAEDDHNMFILQINDVFIDQLVHGVRGFVADGNFHTVSFSKDEILARFEDVGAPTDEGIDEIHLWQDNNTHDYWVDNIRLVKDDSGGSPQPVKIQRTSEIPINDGASGDSRYAEMRDIEKPDIILSANTVLNANWNGRDVITAGHSLTVNPNTQDYKDSFEVYLYNNSATDSAIVLTAKAGVTYTVIDNDVSSATVYLQAFGTAVIKRIGNTQNFIIRGYII